MLFNIPVFIKEIPQKSEGIRIPLYEIRPLFLSAPVVRNELLSRAMTRLARIIRKHLYEVLRSGENDELVPWSFSPDIEDHFFKISVQLKSGTANSKNLIVAFKSLGRKLAFTPTIPDLWFEVHKGQTLRDRATEVFTHYFKEKEKEDTGNFDLEKYSLKGRAWVTTLDIEIEQIGSGIRKGSKKQIFMGPAEKLSGAEELEAVGECLDWLYPDELDRAILREDHVDELSRLLKDTDKRPVLLVGPRKVGKTAIIHEYVYRTVDKRKKRFGQKKNVWHLSPQRLISGMTFVGQWEDRLLAIIQEARQKGHVIFFDDLLGLFLAGQTGQAALSVAHVIKPFIERRDFRLLAEITPEALHILQEKDRGFADLFHVIPVKETNSSDTLRIALTAKRQLEEQNNCIFEIDVLPSLIDIQRRYVPDTAFPGKAAEFMRRLAVKQKNSNISREDVLQEFRSISGLSVSFLDRKQKFLYEDVKKGIRREVIGQDKAVGAVTDVICKARARLNDTDRPFSSFLFLGPTGVGKTQCAKAVASYLFGSEERITRFDMNEFIDAWSVPKLIGTFSEPEGLLTSEVRRQPFCVVLFDEIEKAHPDVFDLLLQVIGEGRLTDALGRTVDFTNAIIIMTSNLGARESITRLGFADSSSSRQTVYVEATEKFFRPEFFNRLDHIIPFERLSETDIEQIAGRLIQDIFMRHGLRQRNCCLEISRKAMDRIVQEGYEPEMGARSLKRMLEKRLTQTVAASLSGLKPGTPTVISVYSTRAGIAINAHGLVNVERTEANDIIDLDDPSPVIDRLKPVLDDFEQKITGLQPEGPLNSDDISPEHQKYFALTEQQRYIRKMYDRIVDFYSRVSINSRTRVVSFWKPRTQNLYKRYDCGDKVQLADLLAGKDLKVQLEEMHSQADNKGQALRDQLSELIMGIALLDNMIKSPVSGDTDRVLLYVRQTENLFNSTMSKDLFEMYRRFYDWLWGFDLKPLKENAPNNAKITEDPGFFGYVLEGPGVSKLAEIEAGTHLFIDQDGQLGVVYLNTVALSPQDDPYSAFCEKYELRKKWLEELEEGKDSVHSDPFLFASVLRLYKPWHFSTDFRTGFTVRGMPQTDAIRKFILSQLPLPDGLNQ